MSVCILYASHQISCTLSHTSRFIKSSLYLQMSIRGSLFHLASPLKSKSAQPLPVASSPSPEVWASYPFPHFFVGFLSEVNLNLSCACCHHWCKFTASWKTRIYLCSSTTPGSYSLAVPSYTVVHKPWISKF